MTSSPNQARPLRFHELPLVEVAARVGLEAPITLTFDLVNELARSLKSEFHQLAEPSQLEVAPGQALSPEHFANPLRIPGAVLSGHKDGLTLSVQQDVIVARWTKQITSPAPKYPRYQELQRVLWVGLDALREQVQPLSPSVVNMSYLNFIGPHPPGNIPKRYLAESAQLTLSNDATQIHKLEGSWRTPRDLDLRFSMHHANLLGATGPEPGYLLTTAGGVRLTPGLDPKKALDNVHEELQEFFARLISDSAKKEWELTA